MSFLNLNLGLLVAEDSSKTNPAYRNTDITLKFTDVLVTYPKSEPFQLAPGEVANIISTLRTLTIDNSTQFSVARPISTDDTLRLTWTGTGTSPGFRTNRNLGIDATSVFSIIRVGPNTARLSTTSGTSLDSSSVQVGDTLYFSRNTDSFTNPFSATNIGSYVVQATGTHYIDFIDNGTASLDANITPGSLYTQAFLIMSPGPVKIGDTVEILSSQFNTSNQGKFLVSDVTPSYIEYTNSYGVLETVTNTDNNIKLFDRLIGFVSLKATGPFAYQTNGSSAWTDLDILGNECVLGPTAILVGSLKAYSLSAKNNGNYSISLTIQTASVRN